MNYEIAKELKEAGFPQNPHNHNEAPDSWFDEDGDLRDYVGGLSDENYCYNPTLSELIEACGEDFGELCKDEEDWYCTPNFISTGVDILVQSGSTPEEAVARLWLALNKK